MKILDLLEHYVQILEAERQQAQVRGLNAPVSAGRGQRVSTVGTLHLYGFQVPADRHLPEDLPISIVPADEPAEPMDPPEGFVVGRQRERVFFQTFESLGSHLEAVTLVPDTSGFLATAASRVADMVKRPERYSLGPAERLVSWLAPQSEGGNPATRGPASSAAFHTIWTEDLASRRQALTTHLLELVRANKRVLVISSDHRSADELLGLLARAIRAAGLPYKSVLSRFELPILPEAAGLPLAELGFEAQMHQFFAKARANKASLRQTYERFRELTPLLAYKADKQKDLTEVKHLEWRLFTRISELQGKIKEIDSTVGQYESLPIWKRLGMQTVGKNLDTLAEYKVLHQQEIQGLLKEVEIVKRRIDQLTPEAAIPKELRPEYQELKEDIARLGGTRKIREMLAAEEGTNRQAFLQNKRVLITTSARVAADPLFSRVRFDVLVADEAPKIPAPFLLLAAGLIRERIVLSGDRRDIPSPDAWAATGQWALICR